MPEPQFNDSKIACIFYHNSLTYVYSYLSGRKQRSKVNNSLSSCAPIKTGVPQGSIFRPLLFNMYINDILTNYADDNTAYAINSDVDKLVGSLENDSFILIKWFSHNDLVMNTDTDTGLTVKFRQSDRRIN